MTTKQYRCIPQKTSINANMEAKRLIEPVLERRGVVIMTSLDVKGTFDAAFW